MRDSAGLAPDFPTLSLDYAPRHQGNGPGFEALAGLALRLRRLGRIDKGLTEDGEDGLLSPENELKEARVRKGDAQEIRRLNRRAILAHLRRGPLTRADLSRLTGLAKSAVSRLVDELLKEGLLEEGTLTSPPLGRPGTLLHLRPGARFALGAEIGVEGTVLLALDWRGEVLWAREWAHPKEAGPEERFARLLQEALPQAHGALGLGFTLPGVVVGNKLLYAPNLGWRDLDLNPYLASFPLPALAENDAKASALSEVFFHGEENLAYLVLSTGLGVGVVSEGRLLRGTNGAAGEVGHWLGPEERPCACGRKGCLETELGLGALLRHHRALGGEAEGLEALLAKAQAGNPSAQAALAHLGEHLGKFLANLAVAYDPARVVVGGKAAELFPFLEAPLRRALAEHAFLETHRALPVQPSSYGHLAAAVGGASLFLARFFELGGLWAESPRRNGGRYEEVALGTRHGLGA
ncbi:ROK family transcriptional regulator [Thermus brockianus]|uniref:ArsR family transcriptional regulator n=1 Tax=Thermus brockianus TaxID=56956 RepID=A0A1J0LVS7_THEBO|nr:xylose repressor [Thermus brockianus]BDG16550.1 ArsR family transcriptional regulator [Thermus brockianus]